MKAQVLVLPSKRLLKYFKNSVKQEVVFTPENMKWMAVKSVRQKVSECRKH